VNFLKSKQLYFRKNYYMSWKILYIWKHFGNPPPLSNLTPPWDEVLATALSIHLLKTGEGLLHACISSIPLWRTSTFPPKPRKDHNFIDETIKYFKKFVLLLPTHAQFGRHTIFCMSDMDYPRASVSFPRIAGSGNEIVNKHTYPTNDVTRCAESAIYILRIFAELDKIE
jgi:hypothetical protein